MTAWAKRQRIPTVYTWLGPFHDHYLTPDRDHPFEVTATYHRLIFERRQLWQRLLLERRPRDILRNYRLHWPLRAAVLLLPCSQFEADIMRQMGMTQPQVVVPLWVDVPWIEQMAHEPPVLDLPRPWLLFVGQLTRRKGYDLAIQALAEVLAVLPQASLLIVSGLNEAQREDGLRLARELGVERHVHMLGYCSDAELINLYRASDALLFPTRYEGFGLPLLEAMAAGCPIVTTDIPVVREIVQHHENGLLVPYNDAAALGQAVVELVQQPAWRERLIAGGRQTLQERYQEDALLLHIEDAYEQACDAKM
ncbi:MAG: glycosyltransferase family 4 protein [Chloroflexaceae bacterium]|nr:glycosyltransferase family 4 protein [Chloroflexaceae bacterium]